MVDICAVYLSSHSHEEAQFSVVNITLSSSHLYMQYILQYTFFPFFSRADVKETVSTAIMFCLYVNIELSFISSINGSISYH